MMSWHSTPEQAPSDAGLLARLTEVKEDGMIWGPNASNVTTCCENKSLYWKIRDAVHDQYRPRNAYQQILADRIAETIWRAERYASFETTALSHEIGLAWQKFEDAQIKPTVSTHDWLAWLSLEGPARKALLEALKLEDRVWRRHRALCAELRTVQKTVREEIIPRKGPTPCTEIENEPTPPVPETTAERAATVTERISTNEPTRVSDPVTTSPNHPQTPTRTASDSERGTTNEPTSPAADAPESSTGNDTPPTNGAATVTERIPTNKPAGPQCPTSDNPPKRTQPPPTAYTPIRTTTEREWGTTDKPTGPQCSTSDNPPKQTQPTPTASAPIRTTTDREWGTTNEPTSVAADVPETSTAI